MNDPIDYIPTVGDSVCARRKEKSNVYHNMIVGPIIETDDESCRIMTNASTEIQGDFRLSYGDWNFQYLFKTKEGEEKR